MEISTWPVFFPVMDLQEPLSPAPLPAAGGGAGGCVSHFLWRPQQQQRIPGPTR